MTRRRLDFYPSGQWARDVLRSRLSISDMAEQCVGTDDLISPISNVGPDEIGKLKEKK